MPSCSPSSIKKQDGAPFCALKTPLLQVDIAFTKGYSSKCDRGRLFWPLWCYSATASASVSRLHHIKQVMSVGGSSAAVLMGSSLFTLSTHATSFAQCRWYKFNQPVSWLRRHHIPFSFPFLLPFSELADMLRQLKFAQKFAWLAG